MLKFIKRYNRLLTVALIISAMCEIGGYIILATTDWRIALGVWLVHYSVNLKKENKQYKVFDV